MTASHRPADTRPRLAILGVALAALTLVLAGCADDRPTEIRAGQPSPGDPTAPGVTTVTTTVPSTGSSTGGEPGAVDPVPPATGGASPPVTTIPEATGPGATIPDNRRQPHRWEGYTVGADGVTLTFTYYSGVEPCSAFDSIVADEGPDSVRVTIYEHAGPDGVVCIMMAQLKSATVTLAAPLAGRTVVDGAP